MSKSTVGQRCQLGSPIVMVTQDTPTIEPTQLFVATNATSGPKRRVKLLRRDKGTLGPAEETRLPSPSAKKRTRKEEEFSDQEIKRQSFGGPEGFGSPGDVDDNIQQLFQCLGSRKALLKAKGKKPSITRRKSS